MADAPSTRAQLQYHLPPSDGSPCTIAAGNPISGQKPNPKFKTTVLGDWHEMEILNLKTQDLDGFDLDRNGFIVVKEDGLDLQDDEWTTEKNIRSTFLPRVAKLVEKVTGAERAVPAVGYAIRSSTNAGGSVIAPAMSVHVDAADGEDGAHNMCRMDLLWAGIKKPERDVLLSKRYRMIQVWKPIKHANFDYPFAVADWQSVDPDKDTFFATLQFPHGSKMDLYSVRHNPAHKWYSLFGQETNEILIFKGFDSSHDGPSRFTFHTSFKHPQFADRLEEASAEMGFEIRGRDSCECRFWIFDP